MKHFPSIGSFRQTLLTLRHMQTYLRSKGQELPDYIDFYSTVKIHGANMAFSYDLTNGLGFQSRDKSLSLANDCFKFVAHHHPFSKELNYWLVHMHARAISLLDGVNNPTLHVYGEWFGKGVKGGSHRSIEPKFVIFAIAVDSQWIRADNQFFEHLIGDISNTLPHIVSINRFPTKVFLLNTDDLDNAQQLSKYSEYLKAAVDAIEKECPVGKHFGVSNPGEGLVFSSINLEDQLVFKVKGDKHAVTVKEVAAVDPQRVESMTQLVASIVTDNRLVQLFEQSRAQGLELAKTSTGKFVQLVLADCLKEEIEMIVESGFTVQEFNKHAAPVASQFYLTKVQASVCPTCGRCNEIP